MGRKLAAMMAMGWAVAGCAEKKMDMAEMTQPPTPAPEMDMLKPLLGTWTGTAELVEPAPKEMAANMPEGSEPPSNTSSGGGTWELALGDMFVKMDGWHETGDGQRMEMVEYLTWDCKAGKFHSWYFAGDGGTGEGWQTPTQGGKKFTATTKGRDARGNPTCGSGTWWMVDDNTMQWTWEETGPMGKMKMKGISTRVAG